MNKLPFGIGRSVIRRFASLICALLAISAQAVPFEMSSNKIYLPVKINGQGPAWFILDTGSVSNVIDSDRAELLRIAHSGHALVFGAGDGSLPSSTARNVTLSVEGTTIPGGDVEVMPIARAVGHSEGRSVDGLLGCPFFNRFAVEIDYAARKVIFTDAARFNFVPQKEAIPIELERGNIFVTATVTLPDGRSAEGKFLVDTAWRGVLTFTSPFTRAQGLPGAARTIQATTGVGIGGPVISKVGRITALQLGKYKLENLFVDFADATNGVLAQSDMAGIIGAEVLRRFKVTFDYQRRRMMLQPNAHFSDPYDFDMSGIYLTAEGPNYNVFKASAVIMNSPASEAGIREGDVIESIDQDPALKFTLEEVRQMFLHEGRTYRLGIRRRTESFSPRITLRRLI